MPMLRFVLVELVGFHRRMGIVGRLLLFQLLVGFNLTAVKFLVHVLPPATSPSFRLSFASIVARSLRWG